MDRCIAETRCVHTSVASHSEFEYVYRLVRYTLCLSSVWKCNMCCTLWPFCVWLYVCVYVAHCMNIFWLTFGLWAQNVHIQTDCVSLQCCMWDVPCKNVSLMTTCPDTALLDFLSSSSQLLVLCLKQMGSASIHTVSNSLLL